MTRIARDRGVRIKSILVPTDFSTPSRRALEYAKALARHFRAKVIVAYVIEPPPQPEFAAYPPAMAHDALLGQTRHRLERFARAYLGPDELEKAIILAGKPYLEIAEAALHLKVNLIVLATHGHAGLKHLLLGSTAERVVRCAPCPVLTVRDYEP